MKFIALSSLLGLAYLSNTVEAIPHPQTNTEGSAPENQNQRNEAQENQNADQNDWEKDCQKWWEEKEWKNEKNWDQEKKWNCNKWKSWRGWRGWRNWENQAN